MTREGQEEELLLGCSLFRFGMMVGITVGSSVFVVVVVVVVVVVLFGILFCISPISSLCCSDSCRNRTISISSKNSEDINSLSLEFLPNNGFTLSCYLHAVYFFSTPKKRWKMIPLQCQKLFLLNSLYAHNEVMFSTLVFHYKLHHHFCLMLLP